MGLGVWQVVLVLVIVLIIFGAGKLPRVMGDVAKGVKNFKSGLAEDDDKSEETTTNRRIDEAEKPSGTATAESRETHRDEVPRS